LIEKKDEQINTLKNDISNLKSTNKKQQQVLSYLTVKHLKMEQDIEALNKRCKKTEEKNLSLLK
jgi:prefoldin subunit 5